MTVGLLILNSPSRHVLTSIVYDTVETALVAAMNFLEENNMPVSFIQDIKGEYSLDLCECHDDVLFVSDVDVLDSTAVGL